MPETTETAAAASGRLSLTGALTISEVSHVKQQLIAAVEQNEGLTIDVTEVTSVDVAGVQLLCAGHRFAAQRNCRMALQVEGNQSFQEMIASLGLERSLSCDAGQQEICLWSAASAGL